MKRHRHVRTSDDEPLAVLRGTRRSLILPASEAEALMRPAGILARARLEAMIAKQAAAKVLPARRQRKAGA
jgi:hypothetical protein